MRTSKKLDEIQENVFTVRRVRPDDEEFLLALSGFLLNQNSDLLKQKERSSFLERSFC